MWEAVRGRMHVLPDDVIFDGDASERLADLLRFMANVAVGVGSGCSGLKYKVHGLSHRIFLFNAAIKHSKASLTRHQIGWGVSNSMTQTSRDTESVLEHSETFREPYSDSILEGTAFRCIS